MSNLRMIVGLGCIVGRRGNSLQKIGVAAAEVTYTITSKVDTKLLKIDTHNAKINIKAVPSKALYNMRNKVVTGVTVDDNCEIISKTGKLNKYPCYFLDDKGEVGQQAPLFWDQSRPINLMVLWKNSRKKTEQTTYMMLDLRGFRNGDVTSMEMTADTLCYLDKMECINIVNAKTIDKGDTKYLAGIDWNIPVLEQPNANAVTWALVKEYEKRMKEDGYYIYWNKHINQIDQSTPEGKKMMAELSRIGNRK